MSLKKTQVHLLKICAFGALECDEAEKKANTSTNTLAPRLVTRSSVCKKFESLKSLKSLKRNLRNLKQLQKKMSLFHAFPSLARYSPWHLPGRGESSVSAIRWCSRGWRCSQPQRPLQRLLRMVSLVPSRWWRWRTHSFPFLQRLKSRPPTLPQNLCSCFL